MGDLYFKMLKYWPFYSLILIFCVYIDVEYQIVLFPCDSILVANATNDIVKTLCASYVSADIFYILINYFPERKRKRKMRPYIVAKLREISESLRLCRDSVIPLFPDKQDLNEDGFVEIFDRQDLYESTVLTSRKPVINHIEDKVQNIQSTIDNLLLIQDFLSNEELTFINELSTSILLTENICPNNDGIDNYIKNQREIGRSIYKLYNKSKIINL